MFSELGGNFVPSEMGFHGLHGFHFLLKIKTKVKKNGVVLMVYLRMTNIKQDEEHNFYYKQTSS